MTNDIVLTDGSTGFSRLDLRSKIRLPGVEIGERYYSAEGEHSQVFLGKTDDGRPVFVKLVDTAWLGSDELSRQQQEDECARSFFANLSGDEARLFVPLLAAGTFEVDGQRILFRVTEYLEDANSLLLYQQAEDDDRAWWRELRRDSHDLATVLKDVCQAFFVLADGGYDPVHLTLNDFVFVRQDGRWRARLIFYGRSFLSAEIPDLSNVPYRMQHLWRVHPALLGREELATEASRAFTLGVVLYQMLFGAHPYHRPGYEIVIDHALEWPEGCDGAFARRLRAMLSRSRPDDRPDKLQILEVVSSPGFQEEISHIPERLAPPEIGAVGPDKHRRRSRIGLLMRTGYRVIRQFGLLPILLRPFRKRSGDRKKRDEDAVKAGIIMRDFCEDAGPLFIKLAQLLTSRKDLFPEKFREQLEPLKDRAPEVSFDLVAEAIKAEWGIDDLKQALLYLDSKPLGSASMAQVHRGRLAGLLTEDVAIKVQKPNVREQLLADLKSLRRLVRLASRVPSLRNYQVTEIFAIFEKSIVEELDFTTECNNITQIAANFADDPSVELPRVLESAAIRRELETSSSVERDRLLVLGFVKGAPLRDRDGLHRVGIRTQEDREELVRNIIRAFLRMVLQHGCYHADPHDGNLFALAGKRLGLIDLGGVGRLTERQRFNLLLLLHGIARNDSALLIRALRLMRAIKPDTDADMIEIELAQVLTGAIRLSSVGRASAALGQILEAVLAIVRKYDITVPPELGLLSRAVAELEDSIGKVLEGGDALQLMREELPKLAVPSELAQALASGDWAAVVPALRKLSLKPAGRLVLRHTVSALVDFSLAYDAAVRSPPRSSTAEASGPGALTRLRGPLFFLAAGLACHVLWVLPANGSEAVGTWISKPLVAIGSVWGFLSVLRNR